MLSKCPVLLSNKPLFIRFAVKLVAFATILFRRPNAPSRRFDLLRVPRSEAMSIKKDRRTPFQNAVIDAGMGKIGRVF